MSIAPPISEAQQARRLADWAAYYEQIQKFEAWRKEHGKTAKKPEQELSQKTNKGFKPLVHRCR